MATITDFKEWISAVDLEDYNEVYCLYKAVQQVEEWGSFNTTKRTNTTGDMYFVKCGFIDDVLMLASDKAYKHFLDYLQKTHAADMDIESWYAYNYALQKND